MLVILVVFTCVNVYANVYFARRESSDAIWHGFAAIWYPLVLYAIESQMYEPLTASPNYGTLLELGRNVWNEGGMILLLINMLLPLFGRYLLFRYRMTVAVREREVDR